MNSVNNKAGRWPNLLIIGAAKCGTTSLHHYLAQHPQVFMSRTKELRYFSDEHNWHRGPDWYRKNFRSERPVCGESSPIYSYVDNEQIADRILQAMPDVKLIYIARDPILRGISNYYDRIHHSLAKDELNKTMRANLAGDQTLPYISGGMHWQRVKPFYDRVSPDQIHIINSDDLFAQRLDTLKEVFRFLDIDPEFECQEFYTSHNSRAEKNRKNRLGRLIQKGGNSWLARKIVSSANTRRFFGERLLKHFSTSIPRGRLDVEVRDALTEVFLEDLFLFRDLTGLDISGWPTISGRWPDQD